MFVGYWESINFPLGVWMHRYSRAGGKQIGIEVHSGNLGEGMRAAIRDIKTGYLAMIEGWNR